MLYRDDDVVFDIPVKSKKKDILKDLDDVSTVEEIDSSMAPSTYLMKQYAKGKKGKKGKEKDKERDDELNSDEDSQADTSWLRTISEFKGEKKGKKKTRSFSDLEFDENGDIIPASHKKKKGKHKKKKGPTNYYKEFETETTLLRDMYGKQSKFVDSLQAKYDAMNNSKTSARGIGKFTTDLIDGITSARNAQLAIVKEQMAIKAKIADLTLKERKEFGDGDGAAIDTNTYASSLVQELIRGGRRELMSVETPLSGDAIGYSSINDEEITQELLEGFGDNDETGFIDFENRGVQTFVVVDNEGNYRYEARDPEGNVVPDYPLPTKEKSTLSFNTYNMTASDSWGRVYPMEVSDIPIADE